MPRKVNSERLSINTLNQYFAKIQQKVENQKVLTLSPPKQLKPNEDCCFVSANFPKAIEQKCRLMRTTIGSPHRRFVISTETNRFFTGSGTEKSIETDLASLSTAWFLATLYFARNDYSEGAVTNIDFMK